MTSYLAADRVVVRVDHCSPRNLAVVLRRRVGEPFAEDESEAQVIGAAAPLEVSGNGLVRSSWILLLLVVGVWSWCWRWICRNRTAAALGALTRTACLSDRMDKSGRRHCLHERLFATVCNTEYISLEKHFLFIALYFVIATAARKTTWT